MVELMIFIVTLIPCTSYWVIHMRILHNQQHSIATVFIIMVLLCLETVGLAVEKAVATLEEMDPFIDFDFNVDIGPKYLLRISDSLTFSLQHLAYASLTRFDSTTKMMKMKSPWKATMMV